LRQKGIGDNLVNISIKEIDEKTYRKTLFDLIEKKRRTIKETNPFSIKNRLVRFAISKGYEPELVWELVKES
jgi:regulatory protein